MILSQVDISPQELQNSEKYTLFEVIDYKNILYFIQKQLKPRDSILWGYYTFLFFTLMLFVYYSFEIISSGTLSFWEFMGKSSLLSFLAFLPVIPIHELLHGTAFKCLGAKKLSYGVNRKEMVFYVTAHNFVLNKSMFYILAMVPFAFFTLLFGSMMCMQNIMMKWIGALLLCGHTSCCIGDFALMSFFNIQSRNGEVFTYDDVTTKTSYFFRKNK